MRLFREPPGIISDDASWVLLDRAWLYTSPTLVGLTWIVLTQWRSDKHLVG